MPRKDGIDTNQEMLADFNAMAHSVFVSAYERQFDTAVSEAYIGKPLNALNLQIINRPVDDTLFSYQELSISPLKVLDAQGMRGHLTMCTRPEDVHEHYDALAARIGSTLISPELNLGALLPVQGIVANYRARVRDGQEFNNRHVGTFKEKPTKFSLALAKTFASEVPDYIASDDFETSYRFSPKVARMLNETTHTFAIEMRTDLPLNGHESKSWLTAYANKMLDHVVKRGERLARLKNSSAPAIILDPEEAMYQEALTALNRAEKILEQK